MGVKLTELGNDGISYRNHIHKIGKLLMQRLMRPWLHFDFVYSLFGHKKVLDAVLKPVHVFTKSIIEKRKKHFVIEGEKLKLSRDDSSENVYFRSKKRRFAMMDTLLKAQQDCHIDDEGIMEETDTFTFEGHDTTSAAMTFSLLLLAHHPEVQEKVFEEIQEVLGDKEELLMDDFNKMEYLDRVVKESMRIYPPVPFISRKFTEDFHHDGVTYKKGSSCHIHIIDVHRDPEFFPDPDRFDPDRFLPENSTNRHNFAFIAFSAGMRNCIGQRFALLELKVMLAKVIANLKLFPVTQRHEVVFISDLVLRCKTPIKMLFKLRENKILPF
jgi:cytochrome P450 family 4